MFDEVAQKLLQPGAVGVIPTDTVYGLVARASDQAAASRLYGLKHRQNKPGTVIAASVEQLIDLGLKARYLKAVEQFWPGAVSVIVPCSNPELVYLYQDKLSLAVRIPDDKAILDLLSITGPLLTTSANEPGEPTADTVDKCREYFGDQVDFYIDGGNLSKRGPSTIVRIVDDAIEVIRQGAVKVQPNE